MTTPSIDAHVRLDSHPARSSAVTASLTGTQAHLAHVALEADGWVAVAENTLVLARIDHEEPYWAEKAAQALNTEGITTGITPSLREAIDEEWTWANYPMSWCTRSDIREVSDQAQKIYDDIQYGHLLIHAHAQDGDTTVAVGTYLSGGKSVYLHGENHLRQVACTFDSPAQARRSATGHGPTHRPQFPLTPNPSAAGPPQPGRRKKRAHLGDHPVHRRACAARQPPRPLQRRDCHPDRRPGPRRTLGAGG
ncbi:hypothetical protein ACIO6T_19480 [Streptomyces sp. NPDC087532]|uniref:hypothetical protein n=1 Tax=unclassified Streptomyces TaxID=2593676 RepID=UPI00333191F8